MTERGFTDGAIGMAHAFRAIMQAISRPGLPVAMNVTPLAPEPLMATSAAVALTLCDFQTPVWLAPPLNHEGVMHYLRFHSGAPMAEGLDRAHFVFLSAVDAVPHPRLFAQGTHEYPDRSATLVIQVAGFDTAAVELSGPGIKSAVGFGAAGVGPSFWEAMAENHAGFPTGVDVIFASPGWIAALPRSTAVRLKETV